MNTWRLAAECKDIGDPDIFYPESTRRPDERRARIADAKWFCSRCPVRPDCLDYAFDRDEEFGIFGGLTRAERLKAGRKSGRAGAHLSAALAANRATS